MLSLFRHFLEENATFSQPLYYSKTWQELISASEAEQSKIIGQLIIVRDVGRGDFVIICYWGSVKHKGVSAIVWHR